MPPSAQAPQSPCTNTLDLGFNKSLDSTLSKVRSFDLDKFEEEILEAWDIYPEDKLHDLFVRSNACCMRSSRIAAATASNYRIARLPRSARAEA